jgi:hypothetical protein
VNTFATTSNFYPDLYEHATCQKRIINNGGEEPERLTSAELATATNTLSIRKMVRSVHFLDCHVGMSDFEVGTDECVAGSTSAGILATRRGVGLRNR